MAPSRGIMSSLRQSGQAYICRSCRPTRTFTTTAILPSGHNRWSKIKHDKGKADAARNRQSSIFAQEITLASKLFGPDPASNPKLADIITKAKREGFSKSSITAAIARGQGRSLSGAKLENVSIEGIMPGNVGVIIDCETDNKNRTLMEVRWVLKEYGGTATPSSFLFRKVGRVVMEKKEGVGMEEALDTVLEVGATDLYDDEDGRLVVSCEPNNTKAVGEGLSKALDAQVAISEVTWEPIEDTMVEVTSTEAAEQLSRFLDHLQEKDAGVQAVAMNVAQGSLDTDTWKDLESRLVA